MRISAWQSNLRLLGRGVLLLFALSILFFGIAHLVPGGICSLYPRESAFTCQSTLGLKSSLPVQYFRWVGTYLHGDLGQSPGGQAVAPEILGYIPPTVILILGGLTLYAAGVFLRLLFRWRGPTFWNGRSSGTLIAVSLPVFWLALSLIYVLGIHWQILPTGRIDDSNIPSFWSDRWFAMLPHAAVMMIINLAKHLVLPSVSLAFVLYVADRATGGSNPPLPSTGSRGRRITEELPAMGDLPLFASILISGIVIVEWVFSYGGLGYHLCLALGGSPPDYAMTLDLLMLASVVVLVCKVATDLASRDVGGRGVRARELVSVNGSE